MNSNLTSKLNIFLGLKKRYETAKKNFRFVIDDPKYGRKQKISENHGVWVFLYNYPGNKANTSKFSVIANTKSNVSAVFSLQVI